MASLYIFSLAKSDLNYDIRDRAKFLKSLMTTATNQTPNADQVTKLTE